MGTFSLWHWLLLVAIILVVLGACGLPRVMHDFTNGLIPVRGATRSKTGTLEAVVRQGLSGQGRWQRQDQDARRRRDLRGRPWFLLILVILCILGAWLASAAAGPAF